MVKHNISWRNVGEIPQGFLQEILQLIMEKKNEKCVFILTGTVYVAIFTPLNDNFQMKISYVYLIFARNIDCWVRFRTTS